MAGQGEGQGVDGRAGVADPGVAEDQAAAEREPYVQERCRRAGVSFSQGQGVGDVAGLIGEFGGPPGEVVAGLPGAQRGGVRGQRLAVGAPVTRDQIAGRRQSAGGLVDEAFGDAGPRPDRQHLLGRVQGCPGGPHMDGQLPLGGGRIRDAGGEARVQLLQEELEPEHDAGSLLRSPGGERCLGGRSQTGAGHVEEVSQRGHGISRTPARQTAPVLA
ncbi:hypothetical protein LIX60_03920 [Streptomyces sp. S07_1.15]|uniref:hypothetical protein n=1 Tax=Streptomyces sp. S07_1.15 TaxID=2873925 RepID=UPI001D144A8C|nr:hypothetical protein [Streptomyces sp. S07_1.15]MCC3650650.1 hypothetical protein [Streptomyces sp. S07_1.15]